MEIKFKHFSELSNEELYGLLRLRAEVFVVEQNCNYLDMDNLDQKAIHVMGTVDGQIVATTRILAAGDSFIGYASIGRIATSPNHRAKGMGKEIVRESLKKLYELYGKSCPVKIGAQAYLLKFYQSFGFVSTGHHYLEDDIPHVIMVKE
ncbi:MAG: GNAT family N-acetyltransferase [Cyclobacteriaceae bacterium]